MNSEIFHNFLKIYEFEIKLRIGERKMKMEKKKKITDEKHKK